jgi:cell division protein FtsL
MKTILAIVGVIAISAIIIWYQSRMQLALSDEIKTLQQQVAQLKTDNQNLSSQLAAVGDAKLLSDQQLNELLRLRGEVARLRQQTNQPAKGPDDRKLPVTALSEMDSTRDVLPDTLPKDVPKESLIFSGYTTPASALQSFYWAATRGDVKTLFASVTPETNAKIIAALQREGNVNDPEWLKAQLIKDFGGLGTLHMGDESLISNDQILINYDGERPGQNVTMIRIGNEWRVSLPSDQ